MLSMKRGSGIRDGSTAAATSKMERFVIIVNGFQPLTIITKRSILDVAAALDLPLVWIVVCTAQKMKFLIIEFWINPQFPTDLFTFTKEIPTKNFIFR